jgi:putative hydrolase of HD superfamily
MEILTRQIQFIVEIDKLKSVIRKSKLFKSDREENDAEHSWHLAVMGMVLADHSNEQVDILRVLKMLLIHDLVEIDAGDVFVFDTVARSRNVAVEVEAARRLFGLLPPEQSEEFLSLWSEFEKGETPEARFAGAMDKLEPVLQNISNNGGSWTEFNVDLEEVLDINKSIREGSAVLWNHAHSLIVRHFNKA